ncbi:MAG TPA: SgcJ/EcaC family oxidoreductase [Xanthobacteraceae bacterium]|jgi:uncharacterized protein (TIGR02246 family)|nr:SgcJ/EcaC family oxidoreductase [Xanthobacteraceae bacterium]
MKRWNRMDRPGYASAAALLLVGLVAWPSVGWSKELGCVAVTEAQIAHLFVVWNDALQTLNPDKVVETYAPDAILLPTVENGPLIGRAAIRGYFVHFLENKPSGKIDERTIRIGCNVAFDAGLYTFTYGTGAPATAARFTYIYEYDGGRWLIAHHHSSKRPK